MCYEGVQQLKKLNLSTGNWHLNWCYLLVTLLLF